jgi:hypothetical protein
MNSKCKRKKLVTDYHLLMKFKSRLRRRMQRMKIASSGSSSWMRILSLIAVSTHQSSRKYTMVKLKTLDISDSTLPCNNMLHLLIETIQI